MQGNVAQSCFHFTFPFPSYIRDQSDQHPPGKAA